MPHVLVVTAEEFGYPVILFIQVISGDRLFHGYWSTIKLPLLSRLSSIC